MNVKIVAGGGTVASVKVFDEAGNDISAKFRSVTWRAEVQDVCRAELELIFVDVEVDGVAKVYGPGSKAIKRVEYEDGSADEF